MAEEIIKVLEYVTNNEVCQAVIVVVCFSFLFKTMRWFE